MPVTCKRGRKFVLCAVYRPPRHAANHLEAHFNCFNVQYQRILLMISDPIHIAEDLNCNMLGADSDLARGKLQEFLDSFSLHQFFRSSTFRSGSLFDVFISNRETFIHSVDDLPYSYSDYLLIKVYFIIPKFRSRPYVFY